MVRLICSVRDSAAQCYGQPFFVPSRGVALRSFADEVNRVAADNALNQHPGDFILYELGSFDDDNGSLESVQPVQLARAVDVLVTSASPK